MAKNPKRNLKKNIIIGIGIILTLTIIIGFSQTQSLLGDSSRTDIVEQTKTANWKGYDVELKSAYFGEKDNDYFYICDSRNDDIEIKNNYDIGDSLKIESYMENNGAFCRNKNYIGAKIYLPAGKLSGTCSLLANGDSAGAYGECDISGLINIKNDKLKELTRKNYIDEKTEYFEIELKEPTEVEVFTYTYTLTSTSDAHAEIVMNFEEYEIEEEMKEEMEEIVREIECMSNIECQNLCGIKTPTCEDNSCFCGGEQIFEIIENKTPIYFYAIPVSILILVALIIWQRRKKPKR